MSEQPEIHLKLTVADLSPAYREPKTQPKDPRFFHFTKSAKEFHDATLITFARADGSEYVIKDLFNRRLKK